MGFSASHADTSGEVFENAVRHQEIRVFGPAMAGLSEFDLYSTERFAMRRGGMGAGGRAISDMAVEYHQRRSAFRIAKRCQGLFNPRNVVGVSDMNYIPAIAGETNGYIFGERQPRAAFYRDVVVVVDPTQIIEAKVAGERRRFRANALHQASVSAYGIDVVIEDGKIRLVVPHSEPALRDCHTDAGRNALSERTGGRLHAGYQVVFGMPWRMTPKLPKAPDIVKGDGRPAQCFVLRIHGLRVRKVKHRPQQHRRVAVRQHEEIGRASCRERV